MKKGKSATIKPRTELVRKGKRQLTDKHAKQFRYATTNKKVATVSAGERLKPWEKDHARFTSMPEMDMRRR